ncbi:MAG: TlpA family protein disulfide reductase [Anaeromicrobium sp.]|jgi:thiol-disulfide isomerase/thioredoxin|uniref:TlpA disulfide reductase family protein n=1 Tax=Anaeromicrobium sp. TaxID=1929132 RepID=UPI0025E60053|nr:TlpA disulfide reductase family protein [Anaeromicrobium sp.]MCT4592658.1 TlpA family protein disulfide reductase [Anaeromicrobium sp.]
MKKILGLVLTIVLVLSLGACGKKEVKTNETPKVEKKEKVEERLAKFPEFKLNDLNGNEVSNEDFKNYDITMINIWGTFCPPCIEELPELEKLSEAYKDKNFRLMGIIVDRDEYGAKELLKEKGATYTNFVPNRNIEGLLANFDAVPTTIFVNKNGEVLRKIVVGSRSFEDYDEIVKELLENQ